MDGSESTGAIEYDKLWSDRGGPSGLVLLTDAETEHQSTDVDLRDLVGFLSFEKSYEVNEAVWFSRSR